MGERDEDGLRGRAAAEVVALHAFFEDWFAGRLPDSDAAFARFADGLDPDFEIVTPRGEALARRALLEALRAAHGRVARRIEVEVLEVRRLGALALVCYHEWQAEGSPPSPSASREAGAPGAPGESRAPGASAAWKGRRSAALLRDDPAAPGGWRWLYVHETWLPGGRGGRARGASPSGDAERSSG